MTVDYTLLREALELTARDRAAVRRAVDEDRLLEAYVADFVAESESLEGHDSKPAEVLDAARSLALG